MARDGEHRFRWGSACAYAFFLVYILMIGIAATFHWRWLNFAYAVAWLVALGIGSVVVVWRAWRHRGEPGNARLDQLAALPRSWQRWMLGEDDDKPSK
jgi:hypothetical protein